MKIIILGAGQVGGTLASHLVREDNDITLVDTDGEQLHSLQEHLDFRTIEGNGAHPDVLEAAGGMDAEMLVAVTNSDEINMIACHVAHALYRTPQKIARVRSMQYLTQQKRLFGNDGIAIDLLISPEQMVKTAIKSLLEQPEALQVVDMADGKVQVVVVKAYYGGFLVGRAIKELRHDLPQVEARIIAIFRKGQSIFPTPETIIEPDDEVIFIAAHEDIRKVLKELRKLDKPIKRLIIAGGGNIGLRLVQAIENDIDVKIIERDLKRVDMLSHSLKRAVVLQGDAADKELLIDENIQETDMFLALTNHDEANIMSALLAKRLGARKTLAIVSRPAYVDIVENSDIDIALSPQQITISGLLAHVRRGDVVNVQSLRRGSAEALEGIARGTNKTSRLVGRKISEIQLPPGSLIAAIVRGETVMMAEENLTIEAMDHVIVFCFDKQYIHEVERQFQVGLTFF